MTKSEPASIHASAVLVGNRAVVIRGPSGAGKSSLAFDLIVAGRAGQIPPAVLVADDRIHLQARQGQLVVRPPRELAGLMEIRGLGIRRCEFASEAIVGLLVDLCADDAQRLPSAEALQIIIDGVMIPRIPVAASQAPLRLVIAALITTAGSASVQTIDDCVKGIGNHISPTIAT